MLTAGTRSHATRQQEKAQTHRTSSYKPAPCRRNSLARLPPPVNILNIFDACDNFLQHNLFKDPMLAYSLESLLNLVNTSMQLLFFAYFRVLSPAQHIR